MNEKKRFHEILEDFTNAMLITWNEKQPPHARPMRVAEVTEASEVWFVTDRQSAKVEELQANPSVLITMQGGSKFLSMTGTISPSDSASDIDRLWSEAWKIWFPEGKTDPSILLLRLKPDFGEFWDNSGTNRWRYLYEAGKAYFQGTEIDAENLNANAKVRL